MFALRPANERGHTQTSWLNSKHTFSFGQYCDPYHMNFGDLRVINDDIVAPNQGFESHSHNNMEIISIVLSGELEHKDSMGNGTIIKPGEIQKMSAGSGITHSEFNPSKNKPVHFLQIWIMPNIQEIKPSYQQKTFDPRLMTDQLKLIISPNGREDSIMISQDAEIYQILLEKDKQTSFNIDQKRMAWIQIAEGSISVNGQLLIAGDGMAIVDEDAIVELKGIDKKSNVLIFNLKK